MPWRRSRLRDAAPRRCGRGSRRRASHCAPATSTRPRRTFLLVDGAAPPLYLIDWEYSAQCEPSWDLADLAAEAAFSEAQDRRLLSLYYEHVTPEREDRFILFKGLLHLLAAAWGATQLAHGSDNTAFEALIVERAAEAERVLHLL